MKPLTRLFIVVCACSTLAVISFAGPEPMSSGKEMKQVAPAPELPSCCNWTGFYLGLHAGGQFGHTKSDFAVFEDDTFEFNHPFGFSESGFNGGGQVGYNYQWNWLVLGAEADFGYMNLDGSGHLLHGTEGSDVPTESDSDFYTTFRGRLGFAHNCWLFYATGGAIGVNYHMDSEFTPAPEEFNVHNDEFTWGYTVGGGVEYKLNCHWSVKVEYLYFALDDVSDRFTPELLPVNDGTTRATRDRAFPPAVPSGTMPPTFQLKDDTFGHIVRAGVNFHF